MKKWTQFGWIVATLAIGLASCQCDRKQPAPQKQMPADSSEDDTCATEENLAPAVSVVVEEVAAPVEEAVLAQEEMVSEPVQAEATLTEAPKLEAVSAVEEVVAP